MLVPLENCRGDNYTSLCFHWTSLCRGVQTLGIPRPHWKKKSCPGPHIKYTNTNKNKTSHNVLSKLAILCWTASIAILGCMRTDWTPLLEVRKDMNACKYMKSSMAKTHVNASSTLKNVHSGISPGNGGCSEAIWHPGPSHCTGVSHQPSHRHLQQNHLLTGIAKTNGTYQ